ncbi:MAG: pilus assembly protein TadG-related protein [Microbacteriaceae bacterium]
MKRAEMRRAEVRRAEVRRARIGDEAGSTMLLTIFYATLALAIILVAVAATSLYLERKRLFTVADGAALLGAEAFDLDDVTPDADGTLRPLLQSDHVAAAVDDYLGSSPIAEFDNLTIERAESVDGLSATVELSAQWRPPVVTLFVAEGIRINVEAVARSVFW